MSQVKPEINIQKAVQNVAKGKMWGSGPGQIDWWGIWASFRIVLILCAGIFLEQATEWVSTYEFDPHWRPVIVAVWMALTEGIRKFLKDYRSEGDKGG